MIKDGFWCAIEDQHMGMTGELVAEKHSIAREMQDAYAVESHRRAASAWAKVASMLRYCPSSCPRPTKMPIARHLPHGRERPRERINGSASQAAPGIQAGWNGDRRQCSGNE